MSPPQRGCQVWAVCSAPQKADKYWQICHPFPLFLLLSASFPGWAWFRGPSQTFWKTSAVAQSRQEYLFLVSICIASSLGEELGGRREEEMWLLCASPRGAQVHPSSPPSPAPAAVAAWDLGRFAFRTFEISEQLEVTISNYPPIPPTPPTARRASVWVACLEESLSLWVVSHCSFRRPRRGDKQVSRSPSQQV